MLLFICMRNFFSTASEECLKEVNFDSNNGSNPLQFLLQNPTNQSLPLVLSKSMKRNECLLNSLMVFNCF